MEVEPVLIAEPDPSSADSLVSRNDPDDLANEQTWPTEDEMQGTETASLAADALPDAPKGTTPKSVKRIPKGMSEYQAAWIVESEDEGEGGDENENEEHDGDQGGRVEAEPANDDEEMRAVPPFEEQDEMETDKSITFRDLDADEEAKQFVLPPPKFSLH
jgi:pre-rRNA-processing protein TSR1